jgi:hypothetical protein
MLLLLLLLPQRVFNNCTMDHGATTVVAWSTGLQHLQRAKIPNDNPELAHIQVVADPSPGSVASDVMQAATVNSVRVPLLHHDAFFLCMHVCVCLCVFVCVSGLELALFACVSVPAHTCLHVHLCLVCAFQTGPLILIRGLETKAFALWSFAWPLIQKR